ncbi:cobalt transport protein [Syntrophobotulus glycolicus DSM 8271]|uniref:Cobalt transport protein n=1 Tax=Syntrophobotulus glycolicus (strain DSM 8271 / FlGlyR) TaxID=645991 RepID=F0T0Y2_SYNGF|nr:energy-coupling factor transporter transmembrane component T [Syntrophobotulus glycolicus]ADY57353.1 cobalt transport protein [Syntrophobotulus glycolicus DSM 8271]
MIDIFTDYVPGNSFLHRLHPLTKIFLTLAALVVCFMENNIPFLLSALGAVVAAAAFSGLFSRMTRVLFGLLILSVILIICQVFFVTEGNTLFYVLPFAGIGRITDEGLRLSAIMALRMVITVSTIPLLMMTTRMSDLASTLTGNLKLPYSYVFMFLTAIQFIPAYLSEMQRIMKAQTARGYDSDTKNIFKKIPIIASLAVPLLVMAVRRVQTRAVSMEIRGFSRANRTNYRVIKPGPGDYAAVILTFVLIGAMVGNKFV